MEREWKFGDWADTPEGILRFVSDRGVRWCLIDAFKLLHYVESRYVKYLPDCTGWDWQPPKPIEQPPGYRLLLREEMVVAGDKCICPPDIVANRGWRDASGKSIGCSAGWMIDNYGITAYARKIAPTYRPFANAAEFEPFAEKWISRSEMGVIKPGAWRPIGYCDIGVYPDCTVMTYADAFKAIRFKDGSPFGVPETEPDQAGAKRLPS